MSTFWSGIEFAALACAVIAAVWLMLVQDKIVPFMALLLSLRNRRGLVSVAPTKSESNLQNFLTWGVGVALPGFGVALALADQQFGLSRLFFVLGFCALTSGFALSANARLYPQILIAVFGAVTAGVLVNKINDWITRLEIAQIVSNGDRDVEKIEAKTRRLIVPKSVGMNPVKCVISPGAGAGGPEYLRMCDTQVAQRVIEMAAKLEDMYDDVDRKARGATDDRKTQIFLTDATFGDDFKKCCQPYLSSMRTEVLSRLGPAANDSDEISQWETAFPSNSPTQAFLIMRWTPYFRNLGVHLKHTVIPRKPTVTMHFAAHAINGNTYAEEIELSPPVPIKSGYIVVDSHHSVVGFSYTLLRSHDIWLGKEPIDNSDLTLLMGAQLSKTMLLVIRIGSLPISKANPLSIRVGSNQKPNVSIQWFDD